MWWEEDTCPRNYYYEECDETRVGYHEYSCKQEYNTTEKYKKGKYYPCPREKPICKCQSDLGSIDMDQACMCIREKSRPLFPSTGVIYWNGTSSSNDVGESPKVTIVHGEVRKDQSGRFLLRQITASTYFEKEEVTIIVPDRDGKYQKYNDVTWERRFYYDDKVKQYVLRKSKTSDKTCKKTTVSEEPFLDRIWQDDNYGFYEFESEKSVNKYHSAQKWVQKYLDDHDWVEWEFNVLYDRRTGRGVPLASYYLYHGYFLRPRNEVRLFYTYKKLEKNNISFKLEDYCNNV